MPETFLDFTIANLARARLVILDILFTFAFSKSFLVEAGLKFMTN